VVTFAGLADGAERLGGPVGPAAAAGGSATHRMPSKKPALWGRTAKPLVVQPHLVAGGFAV